MSERRWLPSPLLSAVIATTWLIAKNSIDPGDVILGAALGISIPLLTRPFLLDGPSLARPGRALALLRVFAWDVVVANFRVAALVLGPNARLRPAFVEVPLELEDEFAIAVLASMITLTPGTLSALFREEERVLVVHALDVEDPDALVEQIKRRYEAPLKEALGC